MIVAGEVSGDLHAADLMRATETVVPEVEWIGIGGDAMQAAGAQLRYHTRDMAVMGISEVLQRLGFFRRVLNEMTQLAADQPPDLLVTVDYPGFNLRLARRVRKLGIKTIQYISPKIWAWNAGRIPKVANAFDRLITIFPFESAWYASTALDVVYAGNPLVDAAARQYDQAPAPLPWSGTPRLALLPGSREHEIARILPSLVETLTRVKEQFPQCAAIIPAPTKEIGERVKRALIRVDVKQAQEIPVIQGAAREVLRQADAALVASGTATLEASLMRCPSVVTYKVTPLTWLLGQMFLKLKFVSLVNIIADREVFPERLQSQSTPDGLATAVIPLLGKTDQRTKMLTEIETVNRALGKPGASMRAARAMLTLIDPKFTDGAS